MDTLPRFDLERPASVDEAVATLAARDGARALGGGTDLVVNLRRGIGAAPPALVDLNGVPELRAIAHHDGRTRIGASVRIRELAEDATVAARLPVLAEAAGSIAGPTHRDMGTVGGNLCLDTRCIFYNQSEWWRASNDYCLKHRGEVCHVAPKSRVCYATFSGDLAPALMVLGARVEVRGPDGARSVPVDALYTGDGERYLALAPGELVTAVSIDHAPGIASGYDKMRVRRSIEYPLAGVAVALALEAGRLRALRIAVTGTNPRPVAIEGLDALAGSPLDDATGARIDALMRKQVMAMRTTFTSGHYRRRVAGVLARRLVRRLGASFSPG